MMKIMKVKKTLMNVIKLMPKYTTKEEGNLLSLEVSIRKIKYRLLWLKFVSFMRVCTENLYVSLLMKRQKGWMLGYISFYIDIYIYIYIYIYI
jgi:hypothetical protein